MGLISTAARLHRRLKQFWNVPDPHVTADGLHICRIERLEPRSMMAVDVPNIHVGLFYYEADSGQDTAGDRFELTFNGGAPGTQLTQLTIDTDKDGLGLSLGDAFFDTQAGGLGASLAFPFTVVDQSGINTVQATVADGGTTLVFNFTGFDVGEKLIFSLDVDEKGFQPLSSNAVVEGEEFEGSKLFATFAAPHFFDTKTDQVDPPRFFDAFSFAGLGLNLPPDNYIPPGSAEVAPVRTAGVSAILTPVPLPITVAGTVFNDVNLNNSQDVGDAGIAGVTVSLLELVGASYVATGKTATTDASGNYFIDGVLPGTYRLVESQPAPYFSVGAKAGTVNGIGNGVVTSVDVLSDIVLLGGQNSIDNDYAEALPAQLSGHVYHDADNDGIREAGEEGIAGAKLTLQRLPSTNPLLGSTFVDVFTDATGFWSATGLRPGNYVVRETQPVPFFDGLDRAGNAGGAAVNPGDEIGGVFLASGQSGENYDFGELKAVSIAGQVHTDFDFDCILDPGEAPIAGVTIFLLNSAGQRIAETQTGADGRYQFTGLAPNTAYGIEEIQPAGFFDGGDKLGSHGGTSPANDFFAGIIVPSGLAATEYNFCEHPPATIGGRVYADDNNNGLIDGSETGIGGVTLSLLNAAGVATGATTVTAADGSYSFTGLAPGVYGVAETQPAGFYDGLDTPGNQGGSAQNPGDRITGASLAPAAVGVNYNFGELRPASIAGRVYIDDNDNGLIDAGETGIGGVTMSLLNAAGNPTGATTTTAADGSYKFDGLAPGVYGVAELQPAGFFDGQDTAGNAGGAAQNPGDKIAGATLGAGVNATQYNFGELRPGSISGRVHADTDGDCVKDDFEIPLSGVTIYLLDASGARIGSTTTNANGEYTFTGLAPKTSYGVEEIQPAGYFDSGDHIGSAGGVVVANDKLGGIVLASGENAVEYNFCEHPPASITGRVHADTDGDCVKDDFEIPLSGVTIYLLDANGTRIKSTTTDANGQYTFTGLQPGVSYGIEEIQPAGYFDSGDHVGSSGGVNSANDFLTQIVLDPGEAAIDYNFCEHPPASITGHVHADTDGDCVKDDFELPLSGVTIYLLDPTGKRIQSTTTDANGQYLFTGLQPGVSYGIEEIQPAGYFDSGDHIGSSGGVKVANDILGQIVLDPGEAAIDYNFCEHPPASLSGRVHADTDGDCVKDAFELPLSGVTIYLLDPTGKRIQSTTTDANGQYLFTGLQPGVSYGIEEIQPAGYFDSGDHIGSSGGVKVANDILGQIVLDPGEAAIDYNFCEHPPASLSGRVHADTNGNCEFDPGELPLSGVTIYLLDPTGRRIQSTTTNANGEYLFTNLQPGVSYGIEEIQPAGYFDSGDHVGSSGGVNSANDLLTQIVLNPGENAIDYDFCEHPPASISGRVHADTDGDCVKDEFEVPLAGVTIYLLDASGARIASTITNAQGIYFFDNLQPGEAYGIEEAQPVGYFDSGDHIGSSGGVKVANDILGQIVLDPGEAAIDYNFCEHPPASIAGRVYVDVNNNGVLDSGESGIAGVTVSLFKDGVATGATTTTDANGFYLFTGLAPGSYGVAEVQPAGYYDGDDAPGTAGGTADNPGDQINGATLTPGLAATQYNFGELLPAEISGFVFRDGAKIVLGQDETIDKFDIETLRPGLRSKDDLPIAGVVLRLLTSDGSEALNAIGQPITAVTDANGFYRFTNLQPGTYSVRQEQPDDYRDGTDNAGTTGGLAANPSQQFSPLLQGIDHGNDAIVLITVGPGGKSQENNFSEVQTTPPDPIPPFIPPPPPPELPPLLPPGAPAFLLTRGGLISVITPPPIIVQTTLSGGSASRLPEFSWHLSILDAGHPRGDRPNEDTLVRVAEVRFDVFAGVAAQMQQSRWLLKVDAEGQAREIVFGMQDGIPVTGDFNGDGITDLGVFRRGQWFIDLNGNGVWDDDDLWAELGGNPDLPVTGDWDGDGKTDIGIFGPSWPNDHRAVAAEPGLPDPDNAPSGAHKNVPPKPADAAVGWRKLKLTSQGKTRADLVDHVFYFGADRDIPVAGDWNGDGVDTIGVFHNGHWILDDNGDGQWLPGETMADFGRAGDIPVVGDFNGDGIDELAVYRNGKWYIDTNGNRRLDAQDQVLEYGGPNDLPVVGDWDGDGKEEVGLYQDGAMLKPAS